MKKSALPLSTILLWFVLSTCSGQEPPSFFDRLEITNMTGKIIKSEDLDATLIFVNFWATWCRPCLQEMPSIENARKVLEKDNIAFVAISEETEERIRQFVTRYDYNFLYTRFPGSLEELDIHSVPTTYILNSRGEILYTHVGAKFWDTEENLTLIRSFLSGTSR